jgi:hypothetical protein
MIEVQSTIQIEFAEFCVKEVFAPLVHRQVVLSMTLPSLRSSAGLLASICALKQLVVSDR